MATQDKEPKRSGISRRTFLKVSGAAAAAGTAGLDFALSTPTAHAAPVDKRFHTTCPYCSASCGQIVEVDVAGNVLDVYGDVMSPNNNGGLCAKGAGAYQLVTNARRLGAFAGTHPANPIFEYDPTYTDGLAYKRTGNGAWSKVALATAMDEIAGALKTARDSHQAPAAANGYNSKGVAFFGSSHMNNEQNYTYRKLIAQFGTSNVEHQARI
jgi:formate dehydrogenase major subunit